MFIVIYIIDTMIYPCHFSDKLAKAAQSDEKLENYKMMVCTTIIWIKLEKLFFSHDCPAATDIPIFCC